MATIIDYTPAKPENPYKKEIADLVAAQEAAPAGTTKAALFTAEVDDKGKSREGIVRRLVSDAARDAGYTARYVKEGRTEDENGTVTLTVILGAKRSRTVKAEDTDTPDGEETPAEVPAEFPAEVPSGNTPKSRR